MSTITERVPRTRCHECGSDDVAAVCHHCGSALCEAHITDPNSQRATPSEFAKLGLHQTACGDRPIHCGTCHHYEALPHWMLYVVGPALFIIGLVLLSQGVGTAAAVALLLGALVGGGAEYLRRTRVHRIRAARPPLPLIPRIDSFDVVETLAFHVRLDPDGSYSVDSLAAQGSINVEAAFGGADHDRTKLYYKKYGEASDAPAAMSCGFVAYVGEPRAVDRAVDGSMHGVIPLDGRVEDFLYLQTGTAFENDGSPIPSRWSERYHYGLRTAPASERVPLSIVPELEPSTDRKVLSLLLRWEGDDDPYGDRRPSASIAGLTPTRITRLSVRVPAVVGAIENSNDPVAGTKTTDKDGTPLLYFEWSDIELARKGTARKFSITFSNPIPETMVMWGEAVVEFEGSLSGIESAKWFYPTGKQRNDATADVRSLLQMRFVLHMDSISYHDVLVMPSDSNARTQRIQRHDRVAPDHVAVLDVVDALSNAEYYIYEIVENLSQSKDSGAIVNHRWDIRGRHLVNLNPVDFHIVLTGPAPAGSQRSMSEWGTTFVELAVQGDYETSLMRSRVENVWTDLGRIIAGALSRPEKALPRVGGTSDITIEAIERGPIRYDDDFRN